MKAIIAGGGIGGLTTALMLHARGIDCELFEQSDQVRELGVNYLLTYLLLGTMSFADALRSLDLFRSEVMPHLAKL